jgi:putative transposase
MVDRRTLGLRRTLRTRLSPKAISGPLATLLVETKRVTAAAEGTLKQLGLVTGSLAWAKPIRLEKGSSLLLACCGKLTKRRVHGSPVAYRIPRGLLPCLNRGLSRRAIFLGDKGRQRFLDLLSEITRLWKVEIYAYCLMGDHYHVLLQTPRGRLARAMRHLDGIYTQAFNRSHHRDGPLFRGRYKAILIDAEEYFLSVVRYIHRNPVKTGLVSDTDRYRWSSHRGYLSKSERPVWLNTQPVLSRFRGVKEYREFMGSEVEKEVADFYKGPYQRSILGDKGFVEWVKGKLGDRARVEEEKPESRRVFGLGVEEIARATAKVYGKRLEALRRKRRGEENEARSMAMSLCRSLGGHKHGEIGRVLGLEKASSVSSACWRMRARVGAEERIARMVRRIERELRKSQERTCPLFDPF